MTPKPHFSLRTLIALVTVAAVGCGALAAPTELWASVVFSGTLLILVAALLMAIVAPRVGAIGFVVCGAAYLGLILAPGAETNIVPNLVTSEVLVGANATWHGVGEYVPYETGMPNSRLVWSTTARWSKSPFHRIGHCLFALLFATVGGLVAGWLGRRSY